MSSPAYSYQDLLLSYYVSSRGDKNLFQNVPSRGLRLSCLGPVDKRAPKSLPHGKPRARPCTAALPSAGAEQHEELGPDLIPPARAAPRGHPPSQPAAVSALLACGFISSWSSPPCKVCGPGGSFPARPLGGKIQHRQGIAPRSRPVP